MGTKEYVKPLIVVLPIEGERSFCASNFSGGGGTIESIKEGELE